MVERRLLTAIAAMVCCVCILGDSFVQAGSIVVWGTSANNLQTQIPAGADFIDVAAGEDHAVALRSDGTIVCWGDHTYLVPDANDIIAIAAGNDFSMALRSTGEILAWGRNNERQVIDAPAGSDFDAIAAGGNHGLALKVDGSIVGWGQNANNQATVPAGNNFIAIAGGNFHSNGIRSDAQAGLIDKWGYPGGGLGTVPVGDDFVAIDAGNTHGIALRSDGSVAAWGTNEKLQVSDTPELSGCTAIAAGFDFNVALNENGSLVAWGNNVDGQKDDVPPGNSFVKISAGKAFALAISEPGSLDLTGPDGGEVFQTATIKTITWDTQGSVDNVEIDYSLDNGTSWIAVSPANEGNTGSYDWLVPVATSQQCLIRVRAFASLVGADKSLGAFTIYTCRLAGDVTGDCVVNLADLAVLASEWMQDAYPFYPQDLNSDGLFDIEDLNILLDQWLWVGQPGEILEDINEDGTVNMEDFADLAGKWDR